MPKWLIIGIVLILNHILWIFFAHVMKCIAEKMKIIGILRLTHLNLWAHFSFPYLYLFFSAAKFVSRKAIYSGKFDDNEK